MRLYAYEDRSGDPTFGVLIADRLLTSGQLVKRGRVPRHFVDPHYGLGTVIRLDDAWRDTLEPDDPPGADPWRTAGQAREAEAGRRDRSLRARRQDRVRRAQLRRPRRRRAAAPAPDRPMLFAKFANAIIGDGEAIVRPPGTHALDLEVELGVVIGEPARRVTEADGDGPRRGLRRRQRRQRARLAGQRRGPARGREGRRPVAARQGQRHVPAGRARCSSRPDEIDPAAGLAPPHRGGSPAAARTPARRSRCRTDRPPTWSSASRRSSSFISQQITLEPGDLIATGTPAGVGVFRDPPVFLEPGDRVRCEIEGIGAVENPIVDWTDDPRPARLSDDEPARGATGKQERRCSPS